MILFGVIIHVLLSDHLDCSTEDEIITNEILTKIVNKNTCVFYK